MSDQKTETTCEHEWEELDSQFSNERYTHVRCKLCGVHGERDEQTKDVFWPAT